VFAKYLEATDIRNVGCLQLINAEQVRRNEINGIAERKKGIIL
jgi:hypothetical protein